MKRFNITLCALILASAINAQKDSVLNAQSKRINGLEQSIQSLNKANASLVKEIRTLKSAFSSQQKELKSTKETIEQNTANIKTTTDELGVKITETKTSAETESANVKQNIKSKAIIGGCIVAALILLLVSLSYFLRNRITQNASAICKIKDAQTALLEESVKLDSKLVDIIENQISTQEAIKKVQAVPDKEADHSLALKIADEIVRIETNLSRMDENVRGYKQLSASVRRIKDNFLANGYEIVDMLGKPYHDGMKVIANFVSDESLKEDEQIISSIIKPQINFNGVMIQAAQIQVKQGI